MTKEKIYAQVEEKYCNGCNKRIESCVWAYRNVNGKTEPNEENCGCSEVPAFIAGFNSAERFIRDSEIKSSDIYGEYFRKKK